jgi:hypothetical protein
MMVEDNVASSRVRNFCNRPLRDDGGPLQAEFFAPRRR